MIVSSFEEATPKNLVNTMNFTDDQKKAYIALIEFLNIDYNENDYKRALIGAAGTGKTYTVKAIIQNCKIPFSKIGLAAPTHKACRVLRDSIGLRNVNVHTLQSDLGLRLNLDVDKFDINNPPFDPKGKIKIKEYSVYIIDEASMIPRDLILFLEKVCKTNKCKIIYIGDGSQLPPVNETYSSAFKNIKSYHLKEIVRQDDDSPVKHLLELLRYDIENKSFNFLNYIYKNKEQFDEGNTKGYKVCTNKEFTNLVSINFNDEQLTKNVDFCKVIAYTNVMVSGWNKFIRNTTIKDSDKSIITKNDLIISYTTIVNEFNEPIIKNSEEYIIKDIVNYTHPKYEISGFLVKFIAIHGGQVTKPLFVVNHLDNFSIQKYIQISDSLINAAKTSAIKIRSQRWREYYEFKETCLLLTNIFKSDGKTILYSRDLDYGFSLTAHKSQGSTFDTVFVDVNDIIFDNNGKLYTNAEEINRRLYVACSRVKSKLYLRYVIKTTKRY